MPDSPAIYESPFFTLAKIFERNSGVQRITFSAYKGGHFAHNPHSAFGYWDRDRGPFYTSSIADNLGKLVLFDILGVQELLEEGLPASSKESLPEVFALMKQQMDELTLGVNSKVLMKDGTYSHIPMLDFSSKVGGLEVVKTSLKRLGEEEGHIYNSGRSENAFHYYGLNLLTPREWQIFYGKCLLLHTRDAEIPDVRYIGHRKIDDFGCLRISRNSQKPNYPRLVYEYKADEVGDVEPLVLDEDRISEIDRMFEGEAETYMKLKKGEPLIDL